MNTLLLRLEGPLQAWGLRSRWGERDTADAPSKSGVIGLLGCALGLRRNDPRLRMISDGLRFGVRIDRPGSLLRDYHTTGGGRYGDVVHDGRGTRFHDEPYAGGVLSPEVKGGRIRVKINATTKEPETDTSERMYLADASFLAALQGAPDLITDLAQAIQQPVWPYFLGRKSCVPALPVFSDIGEYADLHAALIGQPIPERVHPPLRLLLEAQPGVGNRQPDNIDVPARRLFRPRYVKEDWFTPEAPETDTRPSINTLEG